MSLLGGAVATSDRRASDAGAAVLADGGNAVDAAVAAALVLYVVEPQSCGLGGDGFLIHVEPGEPPQGLDGSGEFPLGLTTEALAADGIESMLPRGPRTVTVPSAVMLLGESLRRWGTCSLGDLVGPAIAFATDGFEVGPSLAAMASRSAAEIVHDEVLGPLYVPEGQPVAHGQIVRNQALADALVALAGNGPDIMRTGALADAVVDQVQRDGGYLSHDDLRLHDTKLVHPDHVAFRGHDVWEMPAPTQGPAVVSALREIEEDGPVLTDWRLAIEAMRRGMADAGFDLARVGVPQSPARGDTTYIAVVDGAGRGASLITSVFGDFGAHYGVRAIGGSLGNRAAILRAFGGAPQPGAKPPHTTIPAAVTRAGRLAYVLGVAGGFMQPQAQVQVLVHLLERSRTPQQAIDEPRWKIAIGGHLSLEAGHPLSAEMPDAAARPPGPEGYGACHVAGIVDDRVVAGADHRRHGAVTLVGPAD